MIKSKLFKFSSILLFLTIIQSSCGSITKNVNTTKADSTKTKPTKNELVEVIIKNQTWMSQNLSVTKYRNGDAIPQVQDPKEWSELKTGAWCYYENKKSNGDKYGILYNWYAVNDPRGLAPEGWHIPTRSEWDQLVKNVGGEFLGASKLKSQNEWENESSITNDYKFNALPGGECQFNGKFRSLGKRGFWWTSTSFNDNKAYQFEMAAYTGNIVGYNDVYVTTKTWGYSVRCIKD